LKETVVFLVALLSTSTVNSIVLSSSIEILSNVNAFPFFLASYSSPLTNIFRDSILAAAFVALIVKLFNSIASPARAILPLPIVIFVDPAAASILSANFSFVTSIFHPWNKYSCILIGVAV
jgi:hypothetical protein